MLWMHGGFLLRWSTLLLSMLLSSVLLASIRLLCLLLILRIRLVVIPRGAFWRALARFTKLLLVMREVAFGANCAIPSVLEEAAQFRLESAHVRSNPTQFLLGVRKQATLCAASARLDEFLADFRAP